MEFKPSKLATLLRMDCDLMLVLCNDGKTETLKYPSETSHRLISMMLDGKYDYYTVVEVDAERYGWVKVTLAEVE